MLLPPTVTAAKSKRAGANAGKFPIMTMATLPLSRPLCMQLSAPVYTQASRAGEEAPGWGRQDNGICELELCETIPAFVQMIT